MHKYKTLLEAVRHPGIVQLVSQNGWDVYRINSWDGAQQFTAEGTEMRAGERWSRSERTFNNEIASGHYNLYFVTAEDSSQVTLGVIKDNQAQDQTTIEVEDASQRRVSQEDYPTVPFDVIRGDRTGDTPEATTPGPEPENNQDTVIPELNDSDLGPLEMPATEEDPAAQEPSRDSVSEPNTRQRKYQWDQGRIMDADTGEIVKERDSFRTPVIKYKKIGNHIRITGIRDGVGNLTVPDEIEGLPVTEIAPYSIPSLHYYNIYLPATIKTIPPYTFPNNSTRIHIAPDTKTFEYSIADGVDRFRKDVR